MTTARPAAARRHTPTTGHRAARAAVRAGAVLGAVALAVSVIAAAPAVAAGSLGLVSWQASTTRAGAAADYTYTFKTASGARLSGAQMTVPTGTAGTPTVISATAEGGTPGSLYAISLGTTSASLSGTVLTVSFNSGNGYINPGTVFTLKIGGLSNTSTVGGDTPTMTTYHGSATVDTGPATPLTFTTGMLTGTTLQPTTTIAGAAGAGYEYRFTTATTATLTAVTMTVPPGTAGTPTLGAVTPTSLAGGTLTLTGSQITYTPLSPVQISAGTPVDLPIAGLTNTPDTVLTHPVEVTTASATGPVDSGTTAPVAFSSSALSGSTWTASTLATGADGVGYTYGFTTATAVSLTAVQMTVPGGTSGTPALGTVSIKSGSGSNSYAIVPADQAIALQGTTLSFTFTSTSIPSGAVVSIQVTGLTNTAVPGAYQAGIRTVTGQASSTPTVDTGVTPAVTFTSTSLTSLSWTVSSTATGQQSVTYTLSFRLPQTTTLSTITMSLPPGTGTTATLTSVSPTGMAPGTLNVANNIASYTLATPATIDPSATISIVFTTTNTSTPSAWAATVTALNGTATIAAGTTGQVTFTAAVLNALSWSTTSTAAGAAGVTYTYAFTTSTGASLTTVTMSVPAGTTGTPALNAVTIYDPAARQNKTATAQTITLGQNTLTFTFTLSSYANPGTEFTIQIAGLTNTSTAGSYTAAVATKVGTSAIDSGTSPTLSFSSRALTDTSWSASSTKTGTAGTAYTYTFTPSATISFDTLTFTVPTGTTGAPVPGSATPGSIAVSAAVSLSGSLLTYTPGSPVTVTTGTAVTVVISGLTNTTTVNAYPSTVTASTGGTAVASGTAPAVSFADTSLTGVTWTTSNDRTGQTTSYTYAFTTGSATTIGAVTMTVPTGTGPQGALTVASVQGLGSGTATLDQAGATITFAVTSPAYVTAGTSVTIVVSGITNGPTAGMFTSTVATRTANANGSLLESGTSGTVTLIGPPPIAPQLNFTTGCPAVGGACSRRAAGTQLTLIAVPGMPTSGTVAVQVATNAAEGYLLTVAATALTDTAGHAIAEASQPTTALPVGAFYGVAADGPISSDATLCSPYGSTAAYVGYAPAPTPVAVATMSTGTGTDSFSLTSGITASPTQPAGLYTGTITYMPIPFYGTSAPSC